MPTTAQAPRRRDAARGFRVNVDDARYRGAARARDAREMVAGGFQQCVGHRGAARVGRTRQGRRACRHACRARSRSGLRENVDPRKAPLRASTVRRPPSREGKSAVMTETVKAYYQDATGTVSEALLPAIEATSGVRRHPHQWSFRSDPASFAGPRRGGAFERTRRRAQSSSRRIYQLRPPRRRDPVKRLRQSNVRR